MLLTYRNRQEKVVLKSILARSIKNTKHLIVFNEESTCFIHVYDELIKYTKIRDISRCGHWFFEINAQLINKNLFNLIAK